MIQVDLGGSTAAIRRGRKSQVVVRQPVVASAWRERGAGADSRSDELAVVPSRPWQAGRRAGQADNSLYWLGTRWGASYHSTNLYGQSTVLRGSDIRGYPDGEAASFTSHRAG